MVRQALRGRHKRLPERVQIVLWRKVSVKDAPRLDLAGPGHAEVNAVRDRVILLLRDVVRVVDRKLVVGPRDLNNRSPRISAGDGLVVQSSGILLAEIDGLPTDSITVQVFERTVTACVNTSTSAKTRA